MIDSYKSGNTPTFDASDLSNMFVSYKRVSIPEVTVPTYDDSVTPAAMIAQGNFSKAVDNVKAKFSESPVFKFQYTSSGVTDLPSKEETSDSSSSSSSSTADFIKKEEGFNEHRYKDARGKSIGYGFYGDTYYKGDTITREEADKVLDGIIDEKTKLLAKYPVWKTLNSNQKTALISYLYNVGSIKENLDQALKSGDLVKIRNSMNITTSQGKKSDALVARREREKKLFDS